MVALKVTAAILAAILASIVAAYHRHDVRWHRYHDRIPIKKSISDLSCPDVYGIACKTANIEFEQENNIDFSGNECKVDSSKACENQKRELSSTTADGLKYVPLPPQFGYYDSNNDQKITFEEFSEPILDRYQVQDPGSLKTMFDAADVDDDGVLEPDEFLKAPFVQVTIRNRREEIPNENEMSHEDEMEIHARMMRK